MFQDNVTSSSRFHGLNRTDTAVIEEFNGTNIKD
jgi:hypothetical protein